MTIAFDSDRLVPCIDGSHSRSYFIDGVRDDEDNLGLVVNCRECGRIFSVPSRYKEAEADWPLYNAS
jgi:hypothetical protein